MSKSKQPTDLLGAAKAAPLKRNAPRTSWFDFLTDGQQGQLRELHAACLAGEVIRSRNELRELMCEHFGIKVSQTAFNEWWRKETKSHGEA